MSTATTAVSSAPAISPLPVLSTSTCIYIMYCLQMMLASAVLCISVMSAVTQSLDRPHWWDMPESDLENEVDPSAFDSFTLNRPHKYTHSMKQLTQALMKSNAIYKKLAYKTAMLSSSTEETTTPVPDTTTTSTSTAAPLPGDLPPSPVLPAIELDKSLRFLHSSRDGFYHSLI